MADAGARGSSITWGLWVHHLEQGDIGLDERRFAFLHAVALVHRDRSLAVLERANAMGSPFGLKAWVVSAVPNALIRPLPSLQCWPTLIDRRDNYRLGSHI